MRRTLALLAACSLPIALHAAQPAPGQPAPGQPAPGRPAQPDAPRHAAEPIAPTDPAALAAGAIAYLRAKQDDATGGWSVAPGRPVFPAITGLAVQGLLKNGVDPTDPAVTRAVAFILSKQQPDGGIYDRILPSYNTAIALAALAMLPNPDAPTRDAIRKAQSFLKGLQYGEGAVRREGAVEAADIVPKDHPYYGGWGYGNRGRPDMSNSSFVIEALRLSGLPESDPAFQRALVFLQRCQMLDRAPDGSIVNDAPYAAGSTQGGFIYATSVNREQQGVGQSFAGETAESLSGPPGLVARVRLTARDDQGRPATLAREEIGSRVRGAAKGAPDALAPLRDDAFQVLFGEGFENDRGSVFEIRAGVTDADAFGQLIARAFTDLSDAPVAVERAQHWRGVSRLRAYGSMTYSGFKSYLYAGLSRTDPRVLAAKDWIARHYTLDENPGLGTDGYYYYLLVFARAMHATGEDVVVTPATGRPGAPAATRRWRDDLTARLASLAQPDGSFRSIDDRWMENDPVLITAYSLIALGEARAQ